MESVMSELAVVAKATMLFGIGLVLTRAARRARASVRHVILASTFGAVLVTPIVAAIAPAIAVAVPLASARTVDRPSAGAVDALSTPAGPQAESAAGAIAARWALPEPGVLLRAAWAAGFLVMLTPLAVAMWRSRELRRRALPSLTLRDLVDRLRSRSGIRRSVEIGTHEGVASPLTCGFRYPAIIVPSDIDEWSTSDVSRALIHELEHVRRADWLVQIVARTACAVYWFHPLAWIAWRQLRLEAERASDDAVVRQEEGTDYAQQLVLLARRWSDSSAVAGLAMARRSDLSARVSALLDSGRRRGRAGMSSVVVACAASAILVAVLAPLHAVAAAAPQSAGRREIGPVLYSRTDRGLYRAAERGDIEGIERSLAAGANVNATFQGDGSPLIAAARQGRLAAVGLLLDRGADPNLAVGGDGNPLIMAAREGHVEIVTLLLDRGANINQVVAGDENALIQASGAGHLSVVRLLAGRGADVNARVWADSWSDRQAGEWRSPLSMARKGGHTAVVTFLLSAGARE